MTTTSTTTIIPTTTPIPVNASTATGDVQQGFCIMCGFNFGHIVAGIDDKIMGLLLTIILFSVLFSPFIVMSICYLCGKRKKKYAKVSSEEEGDEDEDVADK